MIYRIKTFTNLGLEGFEITIEADSNRSLPTIDIIWLPDAAIKEAKERIRATFRNTGIELPRNKIILNLSPSDIRKEGTRFDVSMAMAILLLVHEGKLAEHEKLSDYLFFGELGLDGNIKIVNGLLPSVISAIKKGYSHFFVPGENVYELEYIDGIHIYPVNHFSEIVDHFVLNKPIKEHILKDGKSELYHISWDIEVDFMNIKWHILAKRALTIAAAWMHNVLMVWSPWCGKTMLAKAIQGILPPLQFEEVLEVSQIYSLVWKLSKDNPLITQRPFRQVHHTASKISIIWWWRNLTPWEISLAHKWILFFDEVPEFPREVLEVLRQPLEDKKISISRVTGTVQYPANFMFVGTMNPSPCWYYKDPEIACKSSVHEIKNYQWKVSGPLMDRIDMILEIPRIDIDVLLDTELWDTSEQLKAKVISAWQIQQERYKDINISTNSQLSSKHIEQYIKLDNQSLDFVKDAVRKLNLSPRVVHRLYKLARSIADMSGSEQISVKHLAEALQYRNKTLFID